MKHKQEKVARIRFWGRDVYDYSRREIVDPAAAEVDLQEGWWIRCKWYAVSPLLMYAHYADTHVLWFLCRSCRLRKLKMRNPFQVQCWIRHKRSKTHMFAAEKYGIVELDSSARLSQQQKLSRGSLRLRLEMLPNGDFLVNPPYSPRKSKKSADMDEGMLRSVINSLVTLVSEQQDDINELRARLRAMRQETQSMASGFERVKLAQQTLSQNVQCYLENELSESQVHLRRGESSCESESEETQGYGTDGTDRSLTDMSILNDQSQIMEMD